jgi:hypothetical protein
MTIEQLENILGHEQNTICTITIFKMDGHNKIRIEIPADKITLTGIRRRVE